MADDPDDIYTLTLVPDAYVHGVGLVLTQWAWTETIIDQYIWRLLGVRAQRGRIVTSHLAARMKIEMAAALLRKSRLDERLVKEIEDEGKALADLRNLIAHGSIVVNRLTEVGFITSFVARGELQQRSKLITPAILKALARRIAIYLAFLIRESDRLPKQRGTRPIRDLSNPRRRRRRPGTIARRLLPLLEVERQTTDEQQKVARAETRAKKAERDHKSQANDPRRK
jgi:hypothetical protein